MDTVARTSPRLETKETDKVLAVQGARFVVRETHLNRNILVPPLSSFSSSNSLGEKPPIHYSFPVVLPAL